MKKHQRLLSLMLIVFICANLFVLPTIASETSPDDGRYIMYERDFTKSPPTLAELRADNWRVTDNVNLETTLKLPYTDGKTSETALYDMDLGSDYTVEAQIDLTGSRIFELIFNSVDVQRLPNAVSRRGEYRFRFVSYHDDSNGANSLVLYKQISNTATPIKVWNVEESNLDEFMYKYNGKITNIKLDYTDGKNVQLVISLASDNSVIFDSGVLDLTTLNPNHNILSEGAVGFHNLSGWGGTNVNNLKITCKDMIPVYYKNFPTLTTAETAESLAADGWTADVPISHSNTTDSDGTTAPTLYVGEKSGVSNLMYDRDLGDRFDIKSYCDHGGYGFAQTKLYFNCDETYKNGYILKINGITVTLYKLTAGAEAQLGDAKTLSDGNFNYGVLFSFKYNKGAITFNSFQLNNYVPGQITFNLAELDSSFDATKTGRYKQYAYGERIYEIKKLLVKVDREDLGVEIDKHIILPDESINLTFTVPVTQKAVEDGISLKNSSTGEAVEITPTVTMDATSKIATLKYTSLPEGKYILTVGKSLKSKDGIATLPDDVSFTFDSYASGTVLGDRMWLENDRNPYDGAMIYGNMVGEYTFDTSYNSVGYELGEAKTINNIVLTDNDNSNKIHRADLSLYTSDDNVTYERIKDFTATKVNGKVYLYNFTATARYIKVHCHYDDPYVPYMVCETFENYLGDMINAENSTLPASGGGTFSKLKTITITPKADNTDGVAFIDKSLLEGLANGAFRFVLTDGYVLSHYTTDDGVYLRIPSATANVAINVDVWGGNTSAADLSDMNSVFEVTYGNKTAFPMSEAGKFISNIGVAQAPNGDIIAIGNPKVENGDVVLRRSTDGGRTWSSSQVIYHTTSTVSGGGFIVDKERGKMWYMGYCQSGEPDLYLCVMVMESSDNGETWTEPCRVYTPTLHDCMYGDGLIAKTYDGDGPNIDYIFPWLGTRDDVHYSDFKASTCFSRDNGRTWQAGATMYTYIPEGDEASYEGGVSESSIAYLSNGDLAIISRNQWASENHYAQSVSHDNGFTWETNGWRSNIWASNGDPSLLNYNDDIVLLWPGNTSHNATSYTRFPISVAYSNDDMQSWTNKMDISIGTTFGAYNTGYDRHYGTQPGLWPIENKGNKDMFVFWTHHQTGNGTTTASVEGILIEDFDDYLYKTKGAADDFEASDNKYEGWIQTRAVWNAASSVSISDDDAKDGNKSLHLMANYNPLTTTRSIPQIMKGEISYDLKFSTLSSGYGMYLLFKSAFNNGVIGVDDTLFAIKIDKNGNVYGLDPEKDHMQSGLTAATKINIADWNNLKFKFDVETKKAELYINNSKVCDLKVNSTLPTIDGVCFVQLQSISSSDYISAFMDNFLAYEGVSMTADNQ